MTKITKGFLATIEKMEKGYKMKGSFESYKRKPGGKGFCGIIVNFYSEYDTTGNFLPGYATDVENIEHVFGRELNYEVNKKINLNKKQFIAALCEFQEIIKKDNNFDRLVLFILSHGSEDGIYTCEDGNGSCFEEQEGGGYSTVKVQTITHAFHHSKVPNLKGFPKCIFIQACRGTALVDTAAEVEASDLKDPSSEIFITSSDFNGEQADRCKDSQETDKVSKKERAGIPMPSSANILVAFASYPKTVAFVADDHGSWFITELVRHIRDFKNEHLMDIMIAVNNEIVRKTNDVILPVNYIQTNKVAKIDDDEFSIHAYYNGNDLGKVLYSEPNYRTVRCKGVIRKQDQKISDDCEIRCMVESKTWKKTKELTLTVNDYKRDVLENESNIVIRGSCKILNKDGIIIGIGNIIKAPDSNLKIDHIVTQYKDTFEYMAYFKSDDQKRMLDGKEATICESIEQEDIIYKIGKIIQKSPTELPAFKTEARQLCFLESTFTKRFFLHSNQIDETQGIPLDVYRECAVCGQGPDISYNSQSVDFNKEISELISQIAHLNAHEALSISKVLQLQTKTKYTIEHILKSNKEVEDLIEILFEVQTIINDLRKQKGNSDNIHALLIQLADVKNKFEKISGETATLFLKETGSNTQNQKTNKQKPDSSTGGEKVDYSKDSHE